MKMTNKKKILILVGMFALLVVTAVLNYTIAANVNKKPGDVPAGGNYFTNWRSERIATRDNEITYLDTIIANESAEYTSARAAAMEQKLKIIAIMELEVNLEYLIKAAGYEEVAVSIGSTSDNVNVIVKTDTELTKAQVANIYTIIYEEAQIAPDYVRIIPI